LLTGTALAPGTFVSVVVGVLLGGAISVLVVWRELGPTAGEKGTGSQNPMTFATAMRKVAAIYLAITFLFFVVAVVTGETVPIVATALNLGVGLFGFVAVHRSGRPKTSQ
jgi:hypothetical protein